MATLADRFGCGMGCALKKLIRPLKDSTQKSRSSGVKASRSSVRLVRMKEKDRTWRPSDSRKKERRVRKKATKGAQSCPEKKREKKVVPLPVSLKICVEYPSLIYFPQGSVEKKNNTN